MRFQKSFLVATALFFGAMISHAEETLYGPATISGLGARNIGSATMSGRISAIAATREPSGKMTLFVGAASGGVWKSEDGGTRFKAVFDEQPVQSTGAIALDPKNPKNVWVGSGESWTRNSVSIGNGIYKSTDGGETWNYAGVPNSERVAKIVVSPTSSDTVFAAVPGALWSDSPDRGLYKTSDGGRTWDKRDKSNWMVWRPFYFANLIVDPKNPDRVFKTDGPLILSEDAGKSFSVVGGFQGGHGDMHDVWIDPTNTQTVVAGDDGGIWYSYNSGSKWWKGENLPVSQFYHVSLDDKDPFQVYGGLQDNSSWVGQSQYPGGITNAQWENMFGGDGFWMFSDPADPDYLYAEAQGGSVGRVNRHTHEARDIQPKPNYKEKLRWNWNTPIALSPTEKGTIYIGAQFLFRSRDHGQTWDRISPDLTTNDPEKQKQEQSGGVTIDNSAAEMHTTIYSISESPKNKALIWVGTDDGNLQVTRDGGKTWTDVVGNVPGLPKNSWVNWVQASNFDAATAYAAFDRHTFGDMAPYVFRTTDYGKTWAPLVSAQDAKGILGYAHVIKEDLIKSDLPFLGTEFGLWVSIDGGKNWAQFKGNHFPAVAVRDLAIHPRDNDLVLATHGRGIWIIDDITPLRALTPDLLKQEVAFVSARPVQQRIEGSGGWANGDAVFIGDNPPDAAVINYYQRERHLFGKLKLEVLDSSGRVIDELPASKRPGLNRVTWPMRVKPPRVPPAAQIAFAGVRGPRLVPGVYTVRLTKAGKVSETKLTIDLDRRANFSAADRKAQFDAAMNVHTLFDEESALMDRIVSLRKALASSGGALSEADPLRKNISDFDGKVDAVRKKIVATTEGGAITGEERLREHTDQLYGAILSYEGKPGGYQIAYIDALKRELSDVTKEFDQLLASDLPALNESIKAKGQQPIRPPSTNVGAADVEHPSGTATGAGGMLPADFRISY